MAWENSDRRLRLPPDWPERVAKVKVRDGNRCTWRLPSGKRCPRRGTDVDHREPGDDHSLSNLQLLCPHHHGKKTAREGWAAKQKKKAPKRPPERHPGQI